MKRSNIQPALMAAALLLSASFACAIVGASEVTAKAATGRHTKTPPKAAKVRLVDINSASKAELQTLPGVTPVLADRIIAGRPYNSKAFLVTRNVIPEMVYENIRKRINTSKN